MTTYDWVGAGGDFNNRNNWEGLTSQIGPPAGPPSNGHNVTIGPTDSVFTVIAEYLTTIPIGNLSRRYFTALGGDDDGSIVIGRNCSGEYEG
jgi:hypothetical protein